MDDYALLESVKAFGRSHEAALLTSYNSFFPFVEEFVLRRLDAGGCRHVIVAMDGARLTESLSDRAERPKRAGIDYTLLPVSTAAAFHPKLVLLAGPRGGKVIVGSHNLTYSGFALNRELTNVINVDGKSRQGVAAFRAALDFVKDWATEGGPIAERAIGAFERFAPWMTAGPVPVDEDVEFVASTSSGNTLWQHINDRIPLGVRRILVAAPYFDA